jgi:hypothetical protein
VVFGFANSFTGLYFASMDAFAVSGGEIFRSIVNFYHEYLSFLASTEVVLYVSLIMNMWWSRELLFHTGIGW